MRKNAVLMKIVVVAIVIFALTSVALSVGAAAEVNHLSVDGAWVLKETIKDPMVIAETGTIPTTSMVIPAETPPNYFNFRGGIDDSSAYFNWSWESANRNSKGDVIETFCTGQVHEQSTWTIPPSTLVPGQTMKTDLEASFTASQDVIQSHPSCYSSIGGHCIRFSITGFRGAPIGPVGPCVGGYRNELSKKSSETIEWSVPQGIPGDTLEIRICPFSTGMGRSDNAIHFIYVYKEEAPTTTPPDIPPTSTPTPTEPSGFGTTEILKKGFKGNVYYLEEGTSKLPDFSKMTPVGTIYTEKLDIPPRDFKQGFPGITDRFEWFGISYIGGIVIPSDGNYTFKLTSDDGAKLYIDGELVIDNDGIHPPRTVTKEVHLTKGDHLIGVDYFQGPKVTIALQLFVETPGGKETPVKPVLDPSELEEPTPTPSPTQQLKISDLRGTLNTDNDCNLYVADWGDNQVKMIKPNGSVTSYASGIDRPRYQVFDSAGNLYVGSFDGNIYNVSASGEKTVVASGIWSPQSMGFDGAGNLYVAGGYDGKIHRIAPDGSKTTMDSSFAHPTHLAVYADGNIYVVDSGGTLIVMITPEGGKTSLIDLGETISGMATDGEYLYVSHADKISRIDTSGQVTQIATDLDQPTHLTVCNGSVFVTVSDGIMKLKISPVSGALKISDLQPGPEDGKDVHVYSYTYRNWDNANWGTYPVLVVSYKGIHSGVDCIDRTYIEFDLSSLPSDREIANATLSLYCYNQEGEGAEYAVYRVTEPWAEGEGTYHSGEAEPTAPEPWITWNRQPSSDSTQACATEFIAQGSAPRWINLDVTELVENWYEGSRPNYGIVLRLVEENGSVKVLYFHSSESEEVELRPKLVVTFSGGEQPVPTPPPAWCDYFDSTTLDQRWSWVREDPTHWNLTDHPGYLRITTQRGDLYQTNNDGKNLLLTPAPSGDFEVTTHVTINPSTNWQSARLFIYQDDDNHFELQRTPQGGQEVHFTKEEKGSSESHSVPCDLTTVYLKIMKQNNTYTGYWSTDGSSWTNVYQYKDIKFSNLKIGFSAYNGQSSAPEIPADFDYICVAPIGAVPTQTPTPSPTPATSGQTGTGEEYECPQDAEEAYQQYIAAYNKLTSLMAEGKGYTPEAQEAYEEYKAAKACYESRISRTEPPPTPTPAPTPTPTPTPSGSGTSYLEATLTHSGFDFSEGTTGEYPTYDGEVIFWQPGAATHPDCPRDSGYLWWRNTHLDDVNYASQTKDMGAVDIATVREVPAEWDKSPLIPPLLVGHTIVAKCYDGYVKFQVISVDTADESARVKYSYSTDTTFAEGTPTL